MNKDIKKRQQQQLTAIKNINSQLRQIISNIHKTLVNDNIALIWLRRAKYNKQIAKTVNKVVAEAESEVINNG